MIQAIRETKDYSTNAEFAIRETEKLAKAKEQYEALRRGYSTLYAKAREFDTKYNTLLEQAREFDAKKESYKRKYVEAFHRAEAAQLSFDEERNITTTLRAELTTSRRESEELRQLIDNAVTDFDELPCVNDQDALINERDQLVDERGVLLFV